MTPYNDSYSRVVPLSWDAHHPDEGRTLPLPLGKLPTQILKRYVLPFTGVGSPEVVVKPRLGLDFAAIKVAQGYLISSSDPVTGVKEKVGWYAVNVSANDVATSGARPRFLQSVLLLPPNTDISQLKQIVSQVHTAAQALHITVTGGHTELTPGLDRPIVITTCFGLTDRFVTSAGAKVGDLILMTKTAGIEGTSILVGRFHHRLRHLGFDLLRRASKMYKMISIVEDATLAFGTGLIHGMHDPTEGGLIGGLYEMAEASHLGFTIDEKSIPIADETRKICTTLRVDPLKLISSGVLLMAVDPKDADTIIDVLKSRRINAHVIGKFTKRVRHIVRSDGMIEVVRGGVIDEIWRLVSS